MKDDDSVSHRSSISIGANDIDFRIVGSDSEDDAYTLQLLYKHFRPTRETQLRATTILGETFAFDGARLGAGSFNSFFRHVSIWLAHRQLCDIGATIISK